MVLEVVVEVPGDEAVGVPGCGQRHAELDGAVGQARALEGDVGADATLEVSRLIQKGQSRPAGGTEASRRLLRAFQNTLGFRRRRMEKLVRRCRRNLLPRH